MSRNPHYDDDRALIASTLSRHGWVLTADGELTDTADFVRRGDVFTLRATHFSVSPARALNLFITHRDGRELLYMVEYNDGLAQVLAVLAGMSVADEETVARHLARLHEASHEMYVYDGDVPVPLR